MKAEQIFLFPNICTPEKNRNKKSILPQTSPEEPEEGEIPFVVIQVSNPPDTGNLWHCGIEILLTK